MSSTPATSTASLSASLEDYLEAIFEIVRTKRVVRARDIGRRLHVGRSSVTGALHALAQRELIHYAPYDEIALTGKGRELAKDVVRRHEALRGFFTRVLSIPEAEADEAACKLEHAIPESVLERFMRFVDFVERCPRGGSRWLQGFGYFCANGPALGDCAQCTAQVLDEIRSKHMGEDHTAPAAPTTLAALKRGGRAKVVSVGGTGGIRRRLLDMGVTAGTLIEVERVAPLGDPIEVRLKGYQLTLRKAEAEKIAIAPQ